MKKLLLLPLALAFATNAAVAANSVDLRVTGTITPSACDVSLAGGDFDLGIIQASELSATESTYPGVVGGKTLNITCSGATQVAFKAIDNRSGSVPPLSGGAESAFGLGVDSSNNPIGYYRLQVKSASAATDASSGAAQIKRSSDEGVSWTGFLTSGPGNMSSLGAFNASPVIYAFDAGAASDTAQPAPIISAAVSLQVSTVIQPESALDTSTEIPLDGSATIELVYL